MELKIRLAELVRHLKLRKRRKNGERAAREPEGTRVADLYEVREKASTQMADSEEARAAERKWFAHSCDGNEIIKEKGFSQTTAEVKGALEAPTGERAGYGRTEGHPLGDRRRNTPGEDSLWPPSTF